MDLARFRSRLETLHRDLSERAERVENHIRHKDGPVSPDLEEQASERQNDEVVFALDDSINIEMREVEAALNRIEKGTFGICHECGEEIEGGRLDALPQAVTCVRCKELD